MPHPQKIETVHIETLDGELCLYDWQRMEVHNLNPTAATVWQLCDGQTSPQQIAQHLKGDLTPAQAEELVWLTLARLEKAHLLQAAVVKPAGRKTLTRREMLKGLGLAAALLPVVTSIVAPGPVEAQSPQPTATATGTPQPTATPTNTPVTPIILYNAGGSGFDGNMGGRAGADALCQVSGNRPAGYANFRAFLSVNAGDEIRDMPGNYGVPTNRPIAGPNGTVIANDWADLLDGTIDVSLGAAGLPTAGPFWSGGNADGSLSANNCNGWTDNSGINFGEFGNPTRTNSTWLDDAYTSCSDMTYSLFCIAF